MTNVELLDKHCAAPAHGLTEAVARPWRDQHVHVIGHEHVGMDGDAVSMRCDGEAAQIAVEVEAIAEKRRAVVAALNHVKRHAGKVGAG